MPSRCQSLVSHNNLHRNEAKKSFHLSKELIKTIIPAFTIKISKIKSQVTKKFKFAAICSAYCQTLNENLFVIHQNFFTAKQENLLKYNKYARFVFTKKRFYDCCV